MDLDVVIDEGMCRYAQKGHIKVTVWGSSEMKAGAAAPPSLVSIGSMGGTGDGETKGELDGETKDETTTDDKAARKLSVVFSEGIRAVKVRKRGSVKGCTRFTCQFSMAKGRGEKQR